MKHTEEEILEKAKKLFIELKMKREDYIIRKAVFNEDKELARGENEDKLHPCWTIVIDDNSIFDSTDFLTISDETGEPLYLQTKHLVSEIIKDEDGKYQWKD